ncbi:DUF1254 domain-containing protein [Variovorax sp. J22P240]|uniref:DUF1254 domain-containing protein n=1 Tax=Variovorax sp. J22P240 TaxID=3053514 RepID=UPI002574ADB5|nr:DUF1254 domain-containing protein [Variovorax sp. J22P240]MDM0001873.1 DUF1254 domain-containing protein [Variovorax sp. J22P240]
MNASYAVRALTPAHGDLANAAGVPAQLANAKYVESLARIVYYWGYPAVDTFGRTSAWQLMKEPGATLGLFPGAPKNRMGYLADYMPAPQRKVVTPNNDTIYGVGLVDLASDSVVIQTPTDAPKGHYWTIQIVDLFTTVTHQLGSASGTPGGKLLLVGPGWKGEKPAGFIDVLRSPTNVGGVFGRSFAAHSPEAKARARAVLNQIGIVPLSQDKPGRLVFDCEASARNKVFPPGLTAEMVTADPDLLRGRPVNVKTFWDDLKKALDANPAVGPDDAPMADQARTLLALREAAPAWKTLLDRVALEADAELHDGARYHQVGVDAGGNGWQRQENGGAWGTDWFGRAQAAVIYIFVNDYREAIYWIRGTDAKGALLYGRYGYTMNFPKGSLPPVDRDKGGFWSLSMYDQDYYMLPTSPNGRHNIGTVNLDADELEFNADGSLTLHLSHQPPADKSAQANWLPAPEGQFALIVRTYVPLQPLLDGSYKLPNVQRV